MQERPTENWRYQLYPEKVKLCFKNFTLGDWLQRIPAVWLKSIITGQGSVYPISNILKKNPSFCTDNKLQAVINTDIF